MSEDRRGDNVDYILQHLEQSNKRASLLTYFVGIVVMLIFASSFYFTIESLNYKLTAQLQENQETLERVSTLETQLKNIGQILYESNEITESSIRNKEVENLIAKDANRRQITNEERVSLNEFSTQEVTEYKATNNIMAAFEKLDQDKTEEALVLINKAIEQSANSAVAYTLKAEVLNNQKKHVEAISAQTKAIELEKGNIFSSLIPNFYNTRGFLYLEIDDIDNAIKDFETGSSIAKGNERAFIAENVIYSYLLSNAWQKAYDKANDVVSMNAEGGWKWFLRAISADKIKKKDEKKKSLDKWYAQSDQSDVVSLKKALTGTNLEIYTSLLTKP